MVSDISFKATMNFTYGEPFGMAPGVSRLVANNPSAFTFKGTNTYLVGSVSLAVIDPGPDDKEHISAILKAAAGRPITHIFITHGHRDHVDGLSKLQAATGAKSVGYGRSHLSLPSKILGPTGSAFIDAGFSPDIKIGHCDVVSGEDWALESLHTPGHAPDHMCYSLSGTGVVFSGDHVMGWNTTVIAPPEGSMADYLSSLSLLLKRPATVFLPGHGGRIEEPVRFVKAYLIHRRWRERAIYDAISSRPRTIEDIVGAVYKTIGSDLKGAATLSVEAHVEHLIALGEVVSEGPLSWTSTLRAVDSVST